MVRVGVIGDGPRSAVVAQLVALGASIGGASRRPLDEPGVEIHDLERDADGFHALMHLVVRVQPGGHAPTDADREADVTIGDKHDRDPVIETLWRSRVVPFEANVRMRTRAAARRPVLADAQSSWGDDATRLIVRLRHAVGDHAVRIDHIGSTSVPGGRQRSGGHPGRGDRPLCRTRRRGVRSRGRFLAC